MKEDRYEFPLNEWEYTTEPEPFEFPNPTKLILTRKKPKVCVEWRRAPSMFKNGSAYNGDDYGPYYLVQFRVTGDWGAVCVGVEGIHLIVRINPRGSTSTYYSEVYGLNIHPDANGQWSAPVLLPESVYSRLDEITKALEDRVNGGKG